MSDTSQGPGWWMASDGKWYPPEQAPGGSSGEAGAGAGAGGTDDTSAGWAAPSAGTTADAASEGASPFSTTAPGTAGWGAPTAPGTPGAAPYGTPGYGTPYGGMPPQTHSGATTSLVLGIVSIVACGLLTGIPAIITGRKARREIAESGGRQTGDGMALTGLILGIVGTVLSAIGIAFVVLVIILGVAASDDINSDPSDGFCNEDRFLQDPDC